MPASCMKMAQRISLNPQEMAPHVGIRGNDLMTDLPGSSALVQGATSIDEGTLSRYSATVLPQFPVETSSPQSFPGVFRTGSARLTNRSTKYYEVCFIKRHRHDNQRNNTAQFESALSIS